MSGRSLRRLPVLAHARYIGMSALTPGYESVGSDVDVWLAAMKKAVDEEVVSRSTNPGSALPGAQKGRLLEKGC